jgi:hypothetical protein
VEGAGEMLQLNQKKWEKQGAKLNTELSVNKHNKGSKG